MMLSGRTPVLFYRLQGGPSCHVPLAPVSFSLTNSTNNFSKSSALAPRPKLSSGVVVLFYGRQTTIAPLISKSPRKWTATDTPSACGANASSPRASPAFKTLLAPPDPRAFPPDELIAVINLATSKTEEHDQPASRWSLSDLAATILNDAHQQAMSRATIWRILDEADLKPHKSVYWLNSHDPDFAAGHLLRREDRHANSPA